MNNYRVVGNPSRRFKSGPFSVWVVEDVVVDKQMYKGLGNALQLIFPTAVVLQWKPKKTKHKDEVKNAHGYKNPDVRLGKRDQKKRSADLYNNKTIIKAIKISLFKS